MRGLTNWLLLLLALTLAAVGVAAQLGLIHAPFPPVAFGAAAAVFAALIAIRALPLGARRPVVFLVALVLLAALTGGLAYFQFVIKPMMVKSFITAAFAPKATTVTAEAAKVEQWAPELTAIGTLRAYQGVIIAPQAAGVVTAKHFESGDDVEAGALLINIDDLVEQADLANGLAQLKNAEATLARQKTLVVQGNTPQSTVDTALATRDSAAATVERTRAVIAQKAIKAPFAGRLGLRNVDLGQYVAVGTSLVTLQQLDPIYADFPVPEEALSSLAAGQAVKMTVDAIPGRSFEGKIEAIDARVSAESRNVTARAVFANPDRKLLPGMFANLDGHHRRTGGRADPAAHRDRLQSLWRQRLCRHRGAARARAGRHSRQRRRERPNRRAAPGSRRPGARREGCDRGGLEGGRAGGDRRPDQAPGLFAGHGRRNGRASEPGGNAPAMTKSP